MRDGQDGSGLVFRDAHHAQLREVHGANVRAAEALEAANEKKETVDRCKKRPSLDDVNSLAEDTIRDIATDGEHVTVEKVWCSKDLDPSMFLICDWVFFLNNILVL